MNIQASSADRSCVQDFICALQLNSQQFCYKVISIWLIDKLILKTACSNLSMQGQQKEEHWDILPLPLWLFTTCKYSWQSRLQLWCSNGSLINTSRIFYLYLNWYNINLNNDCKSYSRCSAAIPKHVYYDEEMFSIHCYLTCLSTAPFIQFFWMFSNHSNGWDQFFYSMFLAQVLFRNFCVISTFAISKRWAPSEHSIHDIWYFGNLYFLRY